MDFMKVFDQTVREIKREVNIKVLKVPEMEQKVLDATNNEPWGPHGSVLAEIAQATKKFVDCQMVMNVLWTRLTDTARNWRHVYKALSVIEYLVANGSERAVDDIVEHSFQISSLSSFEYVEPNGKDMGINVRKKVETIMGLLNNKDKIQEIRNKAVANRDKYVGLSSSGMTYKPTSASYGSGSSQNDHYGGFGSSKDGFSKKTDHYGHGNDWRGDDKPRSGKGISGENEGDYSNKQYGSTSKVSAEDSYSDDNYAHVPSVNSSALPNNDEDDFDDFNPRGSSRAGSVAPTTQQTNLFGESLIDLMDAPASVPTEATASISDVSAEIDLFADASFVSAPHGEEPGGSNIQTSVDLFAQQSAPSAFSSPVDLFTAPNPSVSIENKPPQPEAANLGVFDPFAAVPLNNFDGSDVFGDFTFSTEPTQNSTDGDLQSSGQKTLTESKTQPKKEAFQVKSGIWADSLSRGLIDLNISAPMKVSLTDIGIVGGLSDGSEEKDKGLPASAYMGRAMGIGSAMGRSGFPSTTTATGNGGSASFSSPGQYQFGSFK
ncbi:clathrin interactor EPSIN 1-like [Aristolochia californica]|uniref:clathrin interactor EPSIN 1-like n=1 Tax=Aristolochia californica TaxID=171875 RepID=UPI0035D8B0C3